MKWKKLGRVFAPSQFNDFSTHAQVPTAIVIDNFIRVYFAARNSGGKSFTTFLDLNIDDPTQILNVHKEAIIGFGKPGTFDEDGVMPSFVIEHERDYWLYYSGWNQKVSTPYHNSMGLAVSSNDGLNFERMFDGPIVERNHLEPYVTVTPTIIREIDHFKMWYVSGIKWTLVGQKYEPVYVIKYAHSNDGINWIRPNIQIIPSKFELEAFSRPTVFKLNNLYHMYFCCRGSEDYRDGSQGYKFGYASSQDGITWSRDDSFVQISGDQQEWDSKMNCYPFYLKVKNEHYLFYNGNGFGQSGFGILKLEN